MRWFRRRDSARDPALAEAQVQVQVSRAQAFHRRDTEQRKLREETRTVTQPLREVHAQNHFADLAMRAMRRRST